MKIVITWEAGDGCTFSCTINSCIEYESIEAAYSDFVDLCRNSKKEYDNYWSMSVVDRVKNWDKNPPSTFKFCNHEYNIGDFITKDGEYFPEFLELNEWFLKNVSCV